MSILTTYFAGLKLANPIIISSSGLTNSADKIAALANANAGAVVIKSLFEEQILFEINKTIDETTLYHTEGDNYLSAYIRQHQLEKYLNVIKSSKKCCDIPIIASINCYSNAEWINFAKEIEQAGADALEINILALQIAPNYEYGTFEKEHVEILKNLKKNINIPIIIKLGDNFTNPISLISQLKQNGAAAIVLFNRFYPLDIDIYKEIYSSGQVLSNGSELSKSLRWTGIASDKIKDIDYAISGGVRDGKDIVKAILSGASAVELCSVIFEKGNNYIKTMINEINEWMKSKNYNTLSQFKGKLNAGNMKNETNVFERTQFIKYFSSKE